MTREEAINVVCSIYQTDAEREALAILVPELREREDERIRKEIIHYILYKASGVPEKQEHEWVSYLERQKEQKPPEVDLEGAARHVYESWMGGTMDDVRRDMVELGLTLTPGRDRERP